MDPATSPATPSSAASTPAPIPQAAVWLGPGLPLSAAELRWRFSRSSGPGGQNVNRTDSRVELLFPLATTASLPPALRQQIGRAHV